MINKIKKNTEEIINKIKKYQINWNKKQQPKKQDKNKDETNKTNIERGLTLSKRKNKTGYFRVSKQTNKYNARGYTFSYQYYQEDGNRKRINSVDIEILEEKVKKQGLEWKIIDEEKAKKTRELSKEKVYNDHSQKRKYTKSQTEYYNVRKYKYKDNYAYQYPYYDEETKKNRTLSSKDLKKLEKKVKDKGLEWRKV